MHKIKLPADLSKYELVGDESTLGTKVFDSIEGHLDINILTKAQAERLVKRGVNWLRRKPVEKPKKLLKVKV